MRVLSILFVFGFLMTGCPSQSALDRCLSDCQRVGDTCNPDGASNSFSTSACQDICQEPNSRLILFPECVTCFSDEVSCDIGQFFDYCVPEHCWDPDVWAETGMAVPYRR